MESDETDGKEKPVKPRRRKGTGGLFRRGKIWYAKWIDHGEATVVSTGIRADGADDKERRKRRKEAEDWLMEQTEPMRLRHRADAVALLMRRLQTTEERLADAVGKTVGKSTLGDMARLFRDSARRPDCSEGQLSRYCAALDRFAAFTGAGKAVADVGDADAEAYSLRHTFVTRAIEAGVPPHVVQAVVGHSSAAMTEHYTHLSDKAVLEAFGKIE